MRTPHAEAVAKLCPPHTPFETISTTAGSFPPTQKYTKRQSKQKTPRAFIPAHSGTIICAAWDASSGSTRCRIHTHCLTQLTNTLGPLPLPSPHSQKNFRVRGVAIMTELGGGGERSHVATQTTLDALETSFSIATFSGKAVTPFLKLRILCRYTPQWRSAHLRLDGMLKETGRKDEEEAM